MPVHFFRKAFGVIRRDDVDTISLRPNGKKVTYGTVIGFFKFRDTIYYRVKGVAGRTVDEESLSFTDSIVKLYPDEFKDYSAKDIGTILVQPLRIVK